MKVTLLSHTPEPEKLIATAAKLCYSSSDIDHLMEGLTPDKVDSFINMLMEIGHESPVEHVTFTFGIEGISRACSHQLVRHRIASYSQKSQRYVNETQFEYVTPPSIKKRHELRDMFDEKMRDIQKAYTEMKILLKNALIEEDGMDPKVAEKAANEDTRFLLPNACCASIIVTMNIRSLFNFFKHRCCNRAQWEIRAVANEMWQLCMDVAPNIFQHAGPDCVTKGKCPEGKMSCGNPVKMIHIPNDSNND